MSGWLSTEILGRIINIYLINESVTFGVWKEH